MPTGLSGEFFLTEETIRLHLDCSVLHSSPPFIATELQWPRVNPVDKCMDTYIYTFLICVWESCVNLLFVLIDCVLFLEFRISLVLISDDNQKVNQIFHIGFKCAKRIVISFPPLKALQETLVTEVLSHYFSHVSRFAQLPNVNIVERWPHKWNCLELCINEHMHL